jgi:hypothetical protein
METNVILFFSSVGMVMFLAIGGIVGWIYKETVDASIYAKSGGTVHPEFFDEDGQYINEELLAVRFVDEDDLLDEEDDY